MHRDAPAGTGSSYAWQSGAVFVLGIVVPTLIGVGRFWTIGISNTRFFGAEPSNPIEASTDPTMIVVTIVLTVAMLALVALTVRQELRRRPIWAGVLYLLIGLVPTGLCWYILGA